MKIFNFLLIAYILLGLCACDDDEMTVTPTVSFKETAVTAAEDAETLKVPLQLSAATTGTTVVYVAIKEGSEQGGREGSLFCNVPAYVVLEKGAVRGNVELTIIDNDYPNADYSFDLEITKVEGGAVIDSKNSTCKVTITDNDSKQSVTIGFNAASFEADENAGYTEIPVSVKGLLSDFLTFTVEATDGTAISTGDNWDYQLSTPTVKINEEENWGVVNILLNDSKATKEDRSFKLKITGVQGVSASDTTVGIREESRECEVTIRKVVREAMFADSLIVVSETMKPFEFSVALTAPVDQDVTITFQPKEGATAIENQHYTIESKQLTIRAGETTASTTISIIDDKLGNHDRFCEFEITDVTGNVSPVAGTKCRLVIENDDSSVGFGETRVVGEKGQTVRIPIQLNGVHDKRVVIDLDASMEGVSNPIEYFLLLGKKLEIARGDSVVYAEVQLMRPNVTEYKVNVKITNVTTEGLGVEAPIEENAATCIIRVLPLMTASASSNVEPPSGNEGGAEFLIDGNMDTYWHSKWSSPQAELPHWVQVDMGVDYYVNQVEMWRRGGTNNDIKTCTLQLSLDGLSWDDIETYEFSEATDKHRSTTLASPQRARYVRYYITESNRPPFAGIAEIKIDKTPIFE